MSKSVEQRYKYRNKITGVEFFSSSICSGGAWELVEQPSRTAAKQYGEVKPRKAVNKKGQEVQSCDE